MATVLDAIIAENNCRKSEIQDYDILSESLAKHLATLIGRNRIAFRYYPNFDFSPQLPGGRIALSMS